MEQLTALRATRGSGGGGARPNTGGLARMLLRAIFSVAAVLLTLVAVRQTTVVGACVSGRVSSHAR